MFVTKTIVESTLFVQYSHAALNTFYFPGEREIIFLYVCKYLSIEHETFVYLLSNILFFVYSERVSRFFSRHRRDSNIAMQPRFLTILRFPLFVSLF